MNKAGNIFTGVSLLLCVLLIALWGRSTAGEDRVGFFHCSPDGSDTMYTLHSGNGSIGAFLATGGPGFLEPGWQPGWHFEASLATMTTHSVPPGFLGFRYSSISGPNSNGAPSTSTYIMIPYALLIIATAFAPIRRVLGITRKSKRLESGLCVHCGYDLRGSALRCPECGTFPESGSV
jgi:hypothetical protein